MKILHTADIHIGSNTYGRIDPATGLNTRLLDFKRSFDFMVRRAIDERVDLFLFCGDAYRTADPTPTQQRTFAECLKPLADHCIPIVMIIGNHDHPVSFGKASALDIFGYVQGDVHIFRRPTWKKIETPGGPVQMLALPWPIRSTLLSKEEHYRKSPAEIRAFIEEKYVSFLQRMVEEIDPEIPTLLGAHLTVQGAEIAGSERTSLIEHEPKFSAAQLALPQIDYVALGHIHHPQDRNPGHTPPVVYSGSIERVTFKEWDDRKGFVLVDIEGEGAERRTSYSYVDTPARPFVAIQVDAREAPDPTEMILRAIAAQHVDEAIVRVRYHIDEGQTGQIDLDRIRDALKSAQMVAAVERTVDPVERQRRSVVTTESSLEDAMTQYIEQHDNLAPIKERLLEAALELEREYDSKRRGVA